MGKPFISQNILAKKIPCVVKARVVVDKKSSIFDLDIWVEDLNGDRVEMGSSLYFRGSVNYYLAGNADYHTVPIDSYISAGYSNENIDLTGDMGDPAEIISKISAVELDLIIEPTDNRYTYELRMLDPEFIESAVVAPGYIVLDFNDGFNDRYDPYWGGVSSWQDVADYIWADTIDNPNVRLEVTTSDDTYRVIAERASSDGRYLYFNVIGTIGNDLYVQSILYNDQIIGEEFNYEDQLGGTNFGELIKQVGLIGYIKNSALDFKFEGADANKKYTCTQCGYVYEGTSAPVSCPVCKGTDFITT